MKITKAKYLDALDKTLFKGALRRGFKSYAYTGSHKRFAGHLLLNKSTQVFQKLVAEQRLAEKDFVKPCEKPLFVGGITGRAGTTWIQDLFREYAKSHVVIREIGVFMLGQFREAPYEYFQFANFTEGRRKYVKYFRDFIINKAFMVNRNISGVGLHGLSELLPLRGVKLALDNLESRLQKSSKLDEIATAFGDFYIWLFNYHAHMVDKNKRWISKEPPYARHADQLFAMIPNAKLLVMARDGRDTAVSMHTRGWHSDLQTAIDRWRYFTEMTLRALNRCPQDQYMLVRYEDLATSFEEKLREIFEFFELDHVDFKAILQDPVLKPTSAAIGKWKQKMNETEKSYFSDTCSRIMTALGYQV